MAGATAAVSTAAFTCKKCGHPFTADVQKCDQLFLDFDDGRGGLTGNFGLWAHCPHCGKLCGKIVN